MKNLKYSLVLFGLLIALLGNAQTNPKKVSLEQIPGEFTTQTVSLDAGTYIFEISNKNVDHAVGFVLAPKQDEITAEDHIKEAYLSKTIAAGETGLSQQVTLEKGEYVYFCPLNPTPQYTVIVK